MQREDFKLLTAENYQPLAHFNRAFPSESCEWSLSNLLLYCDTYLWHYAVINERLYVVSFAEQYMFYPKGPALEASALREVMQKLAVYCGGKIICGDVPPEFSAAQTVAADLSLSIDPGEADYIYDLELLASFSGSKLRKRHNQVRQFEREYSSRWCASPIRFDDLDMILKFAERLSGLIWQSDSGYEEKLAFGRLRQLWNCPAAGLAGVKLEVDGNLAGFSVYSKLMDKMADIHFEKADHAYRGCGAKLTALLTEHLLERSYRFMNREQDLNEDGLRRAKRALDPVRMYERKSILLT